MTLPIVDDLLGLVKGTFMLEKNFNEHASRLLAIIEQRVSHTAYISVLLFNKEKLIKSINNNYNNWAESYNEEDMSHDNIFYEISHRKLKKSDQALCFWNSIPHTSKESLEIDERRIKFGLYNGVTILEHVNEQYTLGINLTSDNIVNEDVFYSKVILNRKSFMTELRKLLDIN